MLGDVVKAHRDSLIPARETIVERSQQRQNYMLIGVFELALQLRFILDMSMTRCGLVGPSPRGPGDDASRLDPSLG